MHVALFTPGWPAAAFPNGIVTYVDAMRLQLLAQGHRVSIFTPALGPGQRGADVHLVEADARARLLTRVQSRLNGKPPSAFDFGSTLVECLRRVHARDPIDVIEMEESFGWAGAVCRGLDVPLVVKLHGPAFLHLIEEDRRTPFGQEKIEREGEALARLPVIMSPSHCQLAETFARYALRPGIGERVVNPVTMPADAPLWDLEHCDRNTLLFVGRFDKVKGADLVLLALAALLKHRPKLKLIFVGPDNGMVLADGTFVKLKEYVQTLNDPAIDGALSHRGRLDRCAIRSLRAEALLTIVPSRCESQGYTALEAMLQGCPVVCADVSGLGEIVEHEVTGLKARAEDVSDLAQQILRIVDEPALGARLGESGRQYVLSRHAPASVVAQTLDLYRRAIVAHRMPPRG